MTLIEIDDPRMIEIDDPRTPIIRALRLAHRGLDRLPPAAAVLRERMLSAVPVVVTVA